MEKAAWLDHTQLFKGVIPHHVEGRWMVPYFPQSPSNVIHIREVHLGGSSSYPTPRILPLPKKLHNERFVGQPICIATRGEILVVQFNTMSHKRVRFLFIDLSKNTVQMMKISLNNLARDPILLGFDKSTTAVMPIECLINPSLSTVLFGSPTPMSYQSLRNVAPSHSMDTVPVYCAPLETRFVETGPRFRIGEIDQLDVYADQECNVKCFHPWYKNVLFTATFTEERIYCQAYDLVNFIIKERWFPWREQNNNANVVDNRILLQCNGAFCLSGEYFIICALLMPPTTPINYQVVLFIIDPQTMELQTTVKEGVRRFIFPGIFHPESQMFAPFFSLCDQEICVCFLEKGKVPAKAFTYKMKREESLQHLCRVAVRRNIPLHLIDRLRYPFKLVNYLKFKHDLMDVLEKDGLTRQL